MTLHERLLLVTLSGVLLAFCLPPHDVQWLGWIAIAPLLIATRGARPLAAMAGGVASCAVAAGMTLWNDRHGDGLSAACGPYLWLAMLLGLVAVVAAGAGKRKEYGTGWRWIFIVATTAIVCEWLTTFSPLPLNLAVCQYRSLAIIQVASITGIWGVSFLVWWTNALVADACLQGRVQPRLAAVTLAVLLACVGYGLREGQRLNTGPKIHVAAVQPHRLQRNLEIFTRQAVTDGAEVVVWPEYALGHAFKPERSDDPVRQLASRLRCFLVVGYVQPALRRAYNCLALIDAHGHIAGIHRKIRLYSNEVNTTQPGTVTASFPGRRGKIGMEICFESCFTDVTRRLTQSGATYIALSSNDPLVPRNLLNRFHSAFTPFRAIENRIPIARSDTHGLSQIVDAYGRVIAASAGIDETTVHAEITPRRGRTTFYTTWGEWLVWLCMAGLLLEGGLYRAQTRKIKKAV